MFLNRYLSTDLNKTSNEIFNINRFYFNKLPVKHDYTIRPRTNFIIISVPNIKITPILRFTA